MKISTLEIRSWTALATIALAVACGDDDPKTPDTGTGGDSSTGGEASASGGAGNGKGDGGQGGDVPLPPDTFEIVSGDITEDTTWTKDKTWKLDGNVWVNPGVTLTIEPGTFVQGLTSTTNPAVLIVTRGAKLMAEGTPEEPIVFTSAEEPGFRSPGDWGGVILLGAATNNNGEEVAIEGLDTTDTRKNHGGTDDSHDCGTLAYARIEFAGIDLGNGDEVNGLTLGSCGEQTTLHHVMVSNALDDGFEWFGGKMKAHHLVVNNAGDDMFDIDMGARVELDTIFGRQIFPQTSDPNGFEWDNNGGNNAATPVTEVTVSKATLCGNAGANLYPRYGMVLRRGVTGSISEAVVVGFEAGGASLRDGLWDTNPDAVTLTDSIFFENGPLHSQGNTVDLDAWFDGNSADNPGFNAANCRGAGDGKPPVSSVLTSGVGAFAEEADWLEGAWVSWAEE